LKFQFEQLVRINLYYSYLCTDMDEGVAKSLEESRESLRRSGMTKGTDKESQIFLDVV
jgi:hypothetical protein